MASTYNWQGLEQKLSQGKSLEQSARECQIPLDEAKTYAKSKQDLEQYETEQCARSTLEEALEVYRNIIKELEDGDIPIGPKEGYASYLNVKLEAAKQLHKHYLTERVRLDKKLESAKKNTPAGIDPDQGSIFGNWEIKKVE
jgi:hypothetical protein